MELETQCLIAERQMYIAHDASEHFQAAIGEVVRLINGLIRYLDGRLRLRTANREPRTE